MPERQKKRASIYDTPPSLYNYFSFKNFLMGMWSYVFGDPQRISPPHAFAPPLEPM